MQERLTRQITESEIKLFNSTRPSGSKYSAGDYVEKRDVTDLECYRKLGQLEDIEEELGVELITLFKALKNGAWFVDNRNNNIFYAKATLVSKIDGKFEYSQEDLKFNGFIILDQLYGIGNEIKDYGIKWALTKEELEK